MKKKEAVEYIKSKYISKPDSEKYIKNIKTSTPGVRRELYKIKKEQDKKYDRQEAEIKAGIRPSRARAAINKGVSKCRFSTQHTHHNNPSKYRPLCCCALPLNSHYRKYSNWL